MQCFDSVGTAGDAAAVAEVSLTGRKRTITVRAGLEEASCENEIDGNDA